MNIATTTLSVVIATTALAPVAEAAEMNKIELNPFEVTTLAYQGRLAEAGVPGFGALESGIETGTIAAEDVVAAAIASGRLSAGVLEDSSFISAVDTQLDNLVDNN